jgi:hypothetical protein
MKEASATAKGSPAKVAVPRPKAIAPGNVPSRNASAFGHDFSRIPVRSRSDVILQRQPSHTDRDITTPQTGFGEDTEVSSATHASTDGTPRQIISLAAKLKLFRYHRKQKRLALKRALSGVELKTAMDREYQYESWYYVLSGGATNTSGLSWTPISDIAALEDAKPKGLGRESSTPRSIPWLQTDQPLVLSVPEGTGTITATLLDNQDTADSLVVTQDEDELSSGTVKDKGDKVIAHFDSSNGGSIVLHAKLARENIANTGNPAAIPEGPIWALPKFTVLIAPDPIAKESFNPPRVFGPYKEPIRSVLRRLRKAGVKLLEKG